MKKFLCCCAGGSCRSVAMMYELRDRFGHEAIAVSLRRSTVGTLALLYEWADHVLVPELSMVDEFFDKTFSEDKIIVLEIGRDRWRNPMDQKLRRLIRGKLYHSGLIKVGDAKKFDDKVRYGK